MVDDTRRVARPWGFDVDEIAAAVPVLVWHSAGDHQVPVAPWRDVKGIQLTVVPGDSHDPSPELWADALRRVVNDDPSPTGERHG